MKPMAPTMPTRYVAQLFDYLEAQGMPRIDGFKIAGVRTFDSPRGVLTVQQVEALIAEASRLTGRHDLGFEMGRLIKLNSHDVLGYAFISSPTIDQIMRLASRYYRLITPMFTMTYRRHADHAEVLFRPTVNMPVTTLPFYVDALVASLHFQLMALTEGRQTPYDFYTSTEPPPHVHRYRKLTPARFHFGKFDEPGVRAVMDTALLDVPLAMRDPRALEQAEARCKLLMQEMDQGGNWGEWVTMMLREAEDSQPTLDELARILHVSARTLDRHLAKQGIGFRDLAASIRNARACELFATGRFSISQVAYRLGYSDIANFSRAFKRATGLSPSAYQERVKPRQRPAP